MANEYQLTQTGAQVKADLDKVEGMANIKSAGSGLSLSSAGELSASGGSSGTQLYMHVATFDNADSGGETISFVSTQSTQFANFYEIGQALFTPGKVMILRYGNTLVLEFYSGSINYNPDIYYCSNGTIKKYSDGFSDPSQWYSYSVTTL